MASTLKFEVPEELDGERLDKALAMLLGVSRATAKDLMSQGVELDGASVKPNTKVSRGSVITSPEPPRPEEMKPEPVAFDVLYEDEAVIVVNKPTGIVVHPGAGQAEGTLAAGLLHRYPSLKGVGTAGRWGIVHRLDKDTSGAMLVGKTPSAYEELVSALRARDVERVYLALAIGIMKPPTGTIDAPIGRDVAVPTRRAVTNEGKHARTHYRVLRNYENADVALVEVRLETGRTHQIRVHLTAIGHPIVGDRTYAAKPTAVSTPRIFLHATRVRFTHPTTGESLFVEAPLPDDLQTVVDRLDEPVAD